MEKERRRVRVRVRNHGRRRETESASWIAGWTFGFGKIVMAGTTYVMIDGDGTRHSYSGLSRGDFTSVYQTTQYNSLQSYEAYTREG